jgi:hypothetical protein
MHHPEREFFTVAGLESDQAMGITMAVEGAALLHWGPGGPPPIYAEKLALLREDAEAFYSQLE